MTKFRMMLLGTAAVGLTAAAMGSASAGEVEKSVTIGGHVNRAVTLTDNGDNTIVGHQDAGTSMSRVKITGTAASEELTAKAVIEFRARGARTDGSAATSGSDLSIRHSYASLSNNMGTLVLGETDPAGDSGFGSSASGANGYGIYQGTMVHGNSHIVKNAGDGNSGTQESLGTTSNELTDFTSGRGAVLRYDSPDLNGFGISVGTKAGNEVGADLTYSADYDGTAVSAALSGRNMGANSTTHNDHVAGSVAIGLASGLNVSGGYATQSRETNSATTDDVTSYYVELGYDTTVFDAGQTAMNIFYQKQDSTTLKDDDAELVGVNVVQSLSDYGTTVYAGVSQQQYDTLAADYEDITAGWVGVKVAF